MSSAQSHRKILAAGITLVLLGLGGGEQSPAQDAPAGHFLIRGLELDRIEEALEARELVGHEAEGRSFRHLTPVLVRGKSEPAVVDPEQLYRRRLALYDEARLIDEPLPAGEPGTAEVALPTASRQAAPRRGRLWRWLAFSCFGTSLLAGIVLAIRVQLRPAAAGREPI
jgi:hypothetical protein